MTRLDFDAVNIPLNSDINEIKERHIAHLNRIMEDAHARLKDLGLDDDAIQLFGRDEEVLAKFTKIFESIDDIHLDIESSTLDVGDANIRIEPISRISTTGLSQAEKDKQDKLAQIFPFKKGEHKGFIRRNLSKRFADRVEFPKLGKVLGKEVTLSSGPLTGTKLGQPGYTRITYEILNPDDTPNKDIVVKMFFNLSSNTITNIGRLADPPAGAVTVGQQLLELLDIPATPKILETLLDAVIVERADIDKTKTKKIQQDFFDIMEAVKNDVANLFSTQQEKLIKSVQEFDQKFGSSFEELVKLTPFYNEPSLSPAKSDRFSELLRGEIFRPDNVGLINNIPVSIDPGGISVTGISLGQIGKLVGIESEELERITKKMNRSSVNVLLKKQSYDDIIAHISTSPTPYPLLKKEEKEARVKDIEDKGTKFLVPSQRPIIEDLVDSVDDFVSDLVDEQDIEFGEDDTSPITAIKSRINALKLSKKATDNEVITILLVLREFLANSDFDINFEFVATKTGNDESLLKQFLNDHVTEVMDFWLAALTDSITEVVV